MIKVTVGCFALYLVVNTGWLLVLTISSFSSCILGPFLDFCPCCGLYVLSVAPPCITTLLFGLARLTLSIAQCSPETAVATWSYTEQAS